MKKLLITTVGLAMAAVSAYSQGNIFFSNEPLSTQGAVDAPVTAEDRTTELQGSAYRAQLWARPAGASTAYQAIGADVAFIGTTPNGAGYWTPSPRSIPGVPSGSQAQVIARVWRLADGTTATTWDQALARAQTIGRGIGESSPINVTLTAPPALPAPMVGLQPFSLVPEPSTIALGIIGGLGTLVLLRRRK